MSKIIFFLIVIPAVSVILVPHLLIETFQVYASAESSEGLITQFCAALNRGDLEAAEDFLASLNAGSLSAAARILCGLSDLGDVLGPPTTGLQFNAADIAQTNSLKLDSDIKNLVILMPDKRLITQGFLPLDATIVEGTKVIWSNADKMNPHGISLVQDSDNQVLLSNGTIPFKNATQYTFDTIGTYTFSDPTNTDPAAPSGKIVVVAPGSTPDNLSTNSTKPTAGIFVVQAEDKDYFDKNFNTLGYHVEDTYMIPGPDGNNIQVYVYTQKSPNYSTIIDRTAVKFQFVDAQIEEN